MLHITFLGHWPLDTVEKDLNKKLTINGQCGHLCDQTPSAS